MADTRRILAVENDVMESALDYTPSRFCNVERDGTMSSVNRHVRGPGKGRPDLLGEDGR